MEGDVYTTSTLREIGRSRIDPRGLREEPGRGIQMYDAGKILDRAVNLYN